MIFAFGLTLVQANLHIILEHHEEEHEHCEADHDSSNESICQHEQACQWCDFFSNPNSYQIIEGSSPKPVTFEAVYYLESKSFHCKSHVELPPMRGSPLIA